MRTRQYLFAYFPAALTIAIPTISEAGSKIYSIDPNCEASEIQRCESYARGGDCNNNALQIRYQNIVGCDNRSPAHPPECRSTINYHIARECTSAVDFDAFLANLKDTVTIINMRELVRRDQWFKGKEEQMEKILNGLQRLVRDAAEKSSKN